jgi:NAD(P)-dependent dehydrogenase (short-subunit alcohol dehydrogenase family)
MSKAWFITGASSGLGRKLTELALSEGDRVTATVRRPEVLRDLVKASSGRLIIEELDVTSSQEVARVVARCLARGRIDVVVNNAGGGLVGATEEMSDADVQQQIALNLLAPIQIARAFLKPMREQGRGRIIQISSVGGQMATPVSSPYHAAKWGLEGFTEGLSQEVAEFGIHLTIVEPGGMRSGFQSNLRWTTETPTYKDAIVGRVRRQIAAMDDSVFIVDPVRLARAIFDTTRSSQPPLRLTLGPDAYDLIHAALKTRLEKLESQEQLARSMAFADEPKANWSGSLKQRPAEGEA